MRIGLFKRLGQNSGFIVVAGISAFVLMGGGFNWISVSQNTENIVLEPTLSLYAIGLVDRQGKDFASRLPAGILPPSEEARTGVQGVAAAKETSVEQPGVQPVVEELVYVASSKLGQPETLVGPVNELDAIKPFYADRLVYVDRLAQGIVQFGASDLTLSFESGSEQSFESVKGEIFDLLAPVPRNRPNFLQTDVNAVNFRVSDRLREIGGNTNTVVIRDRMSTDLPNTVPAFISTANISEQLLAPVPATLSLDTRSDFARGNGTVLSANNKNLPHVGRQTGGPTGVQTAQRALEETFHSASDLLNSWQRSREKAAQEIAKSPFGQFVLAYSD